MFLRGCDGFPAPLRKGGVVGRSRRTAGVGSYDATPRLLPGRL